MAGWTKILLGTEVGLGPGNIVLDREPASPKGHSAPIFGSEEGGMDGEIGNPVPDW